MTDVMTRQAVVRPTLQEVINKEIKSLDELRRSGTHSVGSAYVTGVVSRIAQGAGLAGSQQLPANLKLLLDGVAQRERSKDPIGFLVGSLIDTLHRAA